MFTVYNSKESFAKLEAKLKGFPKKIEQAAIEALNATGDEAIVALREQMSRDFDRPTPYTLNSLTRTKAKPGQLWVTILPKDSGSGTPATKYLRPEIYGGDRHIKRFEWALMHRGIMKRGQYAYPGKGADIDAHGNMRSGQINQLLSFFGAAERSVGYTANMTAKGKAKLLRGSKKRGFGFEYFAIRKQHGGLVPSIWKRTRFQAGNAVSPILIFGKKPTYARKYRWNETAQSVASARFLYWYKTNIGKLIQSDT